MRSFEKSGDRMAITRSDLEKLTALKRVVTRTGPRTNDLLPATVARI
jgi:hypothetical protein